MGIGVSIFFLAVGAILTWAVEASVSGLDINVVGIILMLVGALGLFVSMMFWSSFAPFRREGLATGQATTATVVREREVI